MLAVQRDGTKTSIGSTMGDKSKIGWTDATWNPVTGCTKVSAGCAYCYITRTPPFRQEGRRFLRGATGVRLHPDRLDQPLRWRKPRRIFVNSLSDLFHEDVPIEFIRAVFYVMEYASQHTFQILTKRPQRARDTWREYLCYPPPGESGMNFKGDAMARWLAGQPVDISMTYRWPPNVWLGVSVENQRMADERIPLLLDTPAAVRFLSVEPMLGPVELDEYLPEPQDPTENCGGCEVCGYASVGPFIDWVIAGGESGGPEHRRLTTDRGKAWLRSLRDQCQAAGVPFFFKQWGGPKPTSGGRLLDGRTWEAIPA